MNKTKLMETYTAEQLAEMVVKKDIALEQLAETHAKAVGDAYRKNQILEENNGRLQSKLDTYNNRLLQRCTKEAKEMIDHNHFSGVRIVTWEQWNNRGKADGKVCFPKEYGQTVREFLNIDTSEIQDDCHRFGIESLQRYLKNPAPIKIPKRDDKNMSISDIQKCQDEYEKLLKESPLERAMNKITKDILEQKNNAMAMEFTRIICDLMKRYGVYVHCTETKFGEKITTNSIEEQYGIAFDSMDFSQHDKEFTEKIEELQSEVEKYRKAFEGAKKERDCQIAEYRKKIEELTNENEKLKGDVGSEGYQEKQEKTNNFYGMYKCAAKDLSKDNLLMFLGILTKELLKNGIDFRYEMENEPKVLGITIKNDKTVADFFPTEPIKVAEMLITAKGECEPLHIGNDVFKDTYRIFDVSELRQIAEHLIIYCNHNGEDD